MEVLQVGILKVGIGDMKISKDQIAIDVLETCLNGSTKMRVVYHSNLNFKVAQRYIDSLVKNGFIAISEDSTIHYKTTNSGKEFLGRLREINGFL